MTPEQRQAVVKEALSWVGTPYRGHSCLKGVGTDCGQLLYGVYHACGLVPAAELPKDYSLQVAAHRVSTEYVDFLDRYMRLITEAEALPADVVVYKLGNAYAHAAIIVEWPNFVIQAQYSHGVSGSHGTNNPALRERRYLQGAVFEFRTLRDEFGAGGAK